MRIGRNRLFFSPRPEDGRRIEPRDTQDPSGSEGGRRGNGARTILMGLCLVAAAGSVAVVRMSPPAEEETSAVPRRNPNRKTIEVLEEISVTWDLAPRASIRRILARAPTRLRYDLMLVMTTPGHAHARAALLAAQELGDDQFLVAVQDLVEDRDVRTRAYAIEARESWKPWTDPELLAHLESDDPGRVAGGIAVCGRRAPPVHTDRIVHGLVHQNELVRGCASARLPRRLDEAALGAVREIAEKGNAEAQTILLQNLARVDARWPMFAAMMPLLHSSDASIRWKAIGLLRERARPILDPSPLIAIAVNEGQQRSTQERVHALDTLEIAQAMVASATLQRIAQDDEALVAYRAARILLQQGEPLGMQRVLELLENTPEEGPQAELRKLMRDEIRGTLVTISGLKPTEDDGFWAEWWVEQAQVFRCPRLPVSLVRFDDWN